MILQRYLLLYLAFLMVLQAYPQTGIPVFYGDILSGEMRSYTAVMENNRVVKGTWNNTTAYPQSFSFSNKKLTRRNVLSNSGSKKLSEFYFYDTLGRYIRSDTYQFNGPLDSVQIVMKHITYTREGFLAKQELVNMENYVYHRYVYVYGADSLPVCKIEYSDNTGFMDTIRFSYDEKGREIKSEKHRLGKIIYTGITTYSTDGSMGVTLFYLENGVYDGKLTFQTDLHGSQLLKKYERSNGEIAYDHSDVYEYDAYGNWIKRIEYEDGVPKYYHERRLVYR